MLRVYSYKDFKNIDKYVRAILQNHIPKSEMVLGPSFLVFEGYLIFLSSGPSFSVVGLSMGDFSAAQSRLQGNQCGKSNAGRNWKNPFRYDDC